MHAGPSTDAPLNTDEYKTLINDLPVGVVVHAPDTRIKVFNQRAAELLRISVNELKGLSAADATFNFIDESGRKLAVSEYPVSVVLRTGAIARNLVLGIVASEHTAQTDHVDVLQAHTWVYCTAWPSFDLTGELSHVTVSFTDITAVKKLEQVERERQALLRKEQLKTMFVAKLSHELKTPLNAVIGFSQLLDLEEPLSETGKFYAASIHGSGRHMLQLVNETLDLATLETGNARLTLSNVELSPLLDDCLGWCRGQYPQVQFDRRASSADTARLAAIADPLRLREVLINLLTNAAKYGGVEKRVEVNVTADQQRVRIGIKDTGLGLSMEQLSSLFQPFNRLGAEKSKHEGTGLGLALAKLFTEAMGGTLTVESSPGDGSEFLVELRCVSLGSKESVQAAPAFASFGALLDTQPEALRAAGLTKALRVLCVDDDATSLRLMRSILEQDPGIEQVWEAASGVDGLNMARSIKPNLVFVSLSLTDFSALEFKRALDATLPLHSAMVVALGDMGAGLTAQDLRASRFFAFLKKPLVPRGLKTLIEAMTTDHGT